MRILSQPSNLIFGEQKYFVDEEVYLSPLILRWITQRWPKMKKIMGQKWKEITKLLNVHVMQSVPQNRAIAAPRKPLFTAVRPTNEMFRNLPPSGKLNKHTKRIIGMVVDEIRRLDSATADPGSNSAGGSGDDRI